MSPQAKFLALMVTGALITIAIEVFRSSRHREWRVEYHYDGEETWFYTEHVYNRLEPAQRQADHINFNMRDPREARIVRTR